MPAFFSHRRKPHPAPVGNWAVLPAIPNSPFNKSFVEQKIHPDLNSLAEELESSQGHELLDVTADKRNPGVKETGFVGLEPSTRRNHRQNEAHTRTQEPIPAAMESEYQQIGIPLLHPASNTNHTEKCLNAESREASLPVATNQPSGSPISITASSSRKRWSIFGRNHSRVPHRNSDASNTTSNVSRSRSQSGSSQPRSYTSQRITRAEGSQPRTPKSQYSMNNSTSHTESVPSDSLGRDDLLQSPHTFGIPTPPQEPIAESTDDNSYFGFRETPPPLPPLDHPAFRQASNHISSTGNLFPIQTMHADVQDRFPRHSHSLPSLTHSGNNNTQFYIKSSKKRRRRASSKSDRFRGEELPSFDKTNKRQHNRNDSVASSIGTRRSSAEYSAKKASSVGHEGKRDECWEVQVSKEMVRLALGQEPPQVYAISPFGTACGKNVGLSIRHQSCFISFIFLAFFFLFSSWRLGKNWGLVHHLFYKARFESNYLVFPCWLTRNTTI